MTGGGAPSVLIVEDEALIAWMLSDEAEAMGLSVCGTAATSARAVEMARAHRPRLLIMDVRLKGDPDGIETAATIRQDLPIPVIFLTGSREQATLDRIEREAPAATVLIKPVRLEELRQAIRRALPDLAP